MTRTRRSGGSKASRRGSPSSRRNSTARWSASTTSLAPSSVRRRELEADLQHNSSSIVTSLSETRAEVASLARLTAEVADLVAAGRPEAAEQVARLEAEANALAERAEAGATGDRLATVFVQYGKSVATEVARAVAENLKDAGYVVPTEDRIPNDAREVRFFHPEDRAAADELAREAATALQGLGFPGLTVEVRDFTGWNKAKPRDGTLELWLALPDAKAG